MENGQAKCPGLCCCDCFEILKTGLTRFADTFWPFVCLLEGESSSRKAASDARARRRTTQPWHRMACFRVRTERMNAQYLCRLVCTPKNVAQITREDVYWCARCWCGARGQCEVRQLIITANCCRSDVKPTRLQRRRILVKRERRLVFRGEAGPDRMPLHNFHSSIRKHSVQWE